MRFLFNIVRHFKKQQSEPDTQRLWDKLIEWGWRCRWKACNESRNQCFAAVNIVFFTSLINHTVILTWYFRPPLICILHNDVSLQLQETGGMVGFAALFVHVLFMSMITFNQPHPGCFQANYWHQSGMWRDRCSRKGVLRPVWLKIRPLSSWRKKKTS